MKTIKNLDALKKLYEYLGHTYKDDDEFIDCIKDDLKNGYLAEFEDGYTYLDEKQNYGIRFDTLDIIQEEDVEEFEMEQLRKRKTYYVECSIVKNGTWLEDTDHWDYDNYEDAKSMYDSIKPYNNTVTLVCCQDYENEIVELKESYE